MAASKKPAKTKGSVKFRDLKAKKNAKGGAFDTYLVPGIKGGSLPQTYGKIAPIG